jgi:hypothetical protein
MGHSNRVWKYAAATWLTLCAAAAMAAEKAATHPDFTGVWTTGPAGPPAAAPPQGAASGARGTGAPAPSAGAAPAGGARGGGAPLPYTPYAKARVDAFQKLTGGTDESPGLYCVGSGMPGSMQGAGGYPMEIFQRPEQIIIVYELHSEIRRIYFGDRNAPEADRVASRSGYSSGHWEGDTLVIETNNLVEQVEARSAHSAEAKIVERYRLEGKDAQGRRILFAEMTMTDPKFYTQPVVATKRWAEVPNGRLLPYECTAETWYERVEELARKAGVPVP